MLRFPRDPTPAPDKICESPAASSSCRASTPLPAIAPPKRSRSSSRSSRFTSATNSPANFFCKPPQQRRLPIRPRRMRKHMRRLRHHKKVGVLAQGEQVRALRAWQISSVRLTRAQRLKTPTHFRSTCRVGGPDKSLSGWVPPCGTTRGRHSFAYNAGKPLVRSRTPEQGGTLKSRPAISAKLEAWDQP